MNTFHINPRDPLACQVVDEVMAFDFDVLVAIRGREFNGEEAVYTVSPCPDQNNPDRYLWTYVRAGEWLAEFYANQPRGR